MMIDIYLNIGVAIFIRAVGDVQPRVVLKLGVVVESGCGFNVLFDTRRSIIDGE